MTSGERHHRDQVTAEIDQDHLGGDRAETSGPFVMPSSA